MCRKEFQIPLTGLDGLQHNFFMQQLVDARKASNRPKECDKVLCEVCFGGSEVNLSKILTATMYCGQTTVVRSYVSDAVDLTGR